MNKITINGAFRFDNFATSFPDQVMGSTEFTPGRNLLFPEADNINWKDLTYRSGLVYNVTGDGKTAIKVAFNKYLLGQTLNGLGRDPNPSLALANSTNRSWTDANADFTPQCDLFNFAANGECGAIATAAFGTTVPSAQFDPDDLASTYRSDLRALLEAKLRGEEIAEPEPTPEPAPAVDLIEALKASVEAAKGAGRAPRAEGKSKAARPEKKPARARTARR